MSQRLSGTFGEVIIALNDSIAVRAYRPQDAKDLAKHGNSRKVWDNLRDRMPHPYTEADAAWWSERNSNPETHVRSGKWTREGGAEGPLVPTHYAITVNDEAVGSIGLDCGSDVYFRSAELGYWLGESYWRQGIMSKVVPAFVTWTWDTFGILVRLNGETHELNGASASLLKKAGFIWEGRKEMRICKNGVLLATDDWGALRPEK